MDHRSSHKRSIRRRLVKGWTGLSDRTKRTFRRLPPDAMTAVICFCIIILGIVVLFLWRAEDIRIGLALTGLGLGGLAWYLWNQRSRLLPRRRHPRSGR